MESKFKRPEVDHFNGHTNYARMCWIIVEVCRDAIWEILISKVPLNQLADLVMISKKTRLFPDVLATFENHSVNKTLPSNTDVDITAIYAIMKTAIKNIGSPTKGWGKFPGEKDVAELDDLERIHIFRNNLLGHAKSASLEEPDYNEKIIELRQIMKRLDKIPYSGNLSNSLEDLNTRSIDPGMEEKYIAMFQKQKDDEEETRKMVANLTARVENVEEEQAIQKERVEVVEKEQSI